MTPGFLSSLGGCLIIPRGINWCTNTRACVTSELVQLENLMFFIRTYTPTFMN